MFDPGVEIIPLHNFDAAHNPRANCGELGQQSLPNG
jgi:hypothetical protein